MWIVRRRNGYRFRISSLHIRSIMKSQLSGSDQVLESIRQVIEKNIGNEQFTVSDLASEVGLSRSMLHRKLIRLTGKSATELITEIRLTRARELLKNNGATVSEVAYKVGFSSPSYFNKVFKKAYHITPGEISRKGPGILIHQVANDNPGSSGSTRLKFNRDRLFTVIIVFMGIIIFSMAILILAGIIPSAGRMKRSNVPDKSIAVLPFRNDSQDQEGYIFDGYMAAILNNLSMIKDLRVINRESVEPYRDHPDIPEILRKFKVGYVLTGSGQKYGDNIRIIVQLMDVDQEIIWSKEYDRRVTMVEDHIAIQSDIAQLVADEIDAFITPQERQRIKRIPTTSLVALNFYQIGLNDFWSYLMGPQAREALEKAAGYFHQALEGDSTYAEAYTGLARTYYEKNFLDEYFSGDFMDSALSLVNRALYFDNQQAPAYLLRGIIYMDKNLPKSAGEDLHTAIQLNPNSWEINYRIGSLYLHSDHVIGLKYLKNAESLIFGVLKAEVLKTISEELALVGFNPQSEAYLRQALELDGDSVDYFTRLAANENWQGNYTRSIEYCLKALHLDSTYTPALDRLAYNFMFLGEIDQAYIYYRELEKYRPGSMTIDIKDLHRIGYVFWKAGIKEEANTLFDLQKQYCLDMISLGRAPATSGFAYYDLAGVYAFQGEKDKALENLRIFNKRKMNGIWMVTLINDDPLFDNIRNEPEFQQILHDVQNKYQAEHERVKQWLEENDMLQ